MFALSITMWIHLNNGDEGLDRFLEKLSLLANNLIIEPHPWKCYLSMRKRNKKNKVTLPYSLEPLRIRNDVVTHIETKLASLGFELVQVSARGPPRPFLTRTTDTGSHQMGT